MNNFWEEIGGIIVGGLMIFGGILIYQHFVNEPLEEVSGTVKYDDCREIVKLKEGGSEIKNKKFTCNYSKTQSGKIMSGECASIETENGICTKAYVYEKEQEGCRNNFKEGIFYPYLGYDDMCYTEPQGGETYVDGFSLPVPNLATSSVLPTEIGQCSKTTISKIGNRFFDDSNIGGTAIEYANSGYQVSYDTIWGSKDSVVGDEVYLCLVSVPENCPTGDDRGKVYSSINLRNGKYWKGQDSQHSCGGA